MQGLSRGQLDEMRWSAAMRCVQRGDEAAYRHLLAELAQALERFLRSRLGNLDIVEDCVQEALIGIHHARHTWNPERPIRPWLFAIARHRAADVLRRLSAQRRAEESRLESALLGDGEIPEGAEAEVTEGWLMRLLTQEQREAIQLTRFEGLSVAEAARCANVSEAAMKVRVHRALRRLTQLLEEEAT